MEIQKFADMESDNNQDSVMESGGWEVGSEVTTQAIKVTIIHPCFHFLICLFVHHHVPTTGFQVSDHRFKKNTLLHSLVNRYRFMRFCKEWLI